MWVNFILFMAIQAGLLLVVGLLPDHVEYSPAKDWSATAILALWMAVSIVACAKIWRNEVKGKPTRSRLHLAIIPAFAVIYTSFIISAFILSPRLVLLVVLVFAFFFIPLLIMVLLYRIENPYSVDLITIPNYARLTGLLTLCLLLVYGGWVWASNWNDGVTEFVGEERTYAEAALKDFEYCIDWSGGPERLRAISRGRFIRRVVDVETLSHDQYSAKVQFYTWMRIPTHSVTFRGTVGESTCPL